MRYRSSRPAYTRVISPHNEPRRLLGTAPGVAPKGWVSMQEQSTPRKRVRARTLITAGGPSGNCAACSERFDHLERDHIVPLFEQGLHDVSNLQWLCHDCHVAKSKAEHQRWRETIGKTIKRTMSEERKREVSEFFRGRPHSPEHVQKATEGMRRAWAKKTPEERAAIAEKSAAKHRGRKHGPMPLDQRQKIGEAQQRKWASGTRKASPPDANTLLVAANRAWWATATPEGKAERGAAISEGKRSASLRRKRAKLVSDGVNLVGPRTAFTIGLGI